MNRITTTAKRIISILLAFTLILCFMPAFTITTFAAGYTNGYVGGPAGDGKGIIAHGIDISKWQADGIDFAKVKADNTDFVIIRAGYRNTADTYFEHNYKSAKAAGLDVGVYWYSYAVTADEALQEAKTCESIISGKKFEYPIYFDFEDPTQAGLSAATKKSICRTWLNYMADKGYLVGLYASYSWLTGPIVPTDISPEYECWMARYFNSGTYASYADYHNKYGMWQYTDSGRKNGYSGNLDSNVCFKDYPSIVKKYGFNGYSAAPSTFTLAFDANGGTGTMAKQTITYGTSTQINANQFTKEGCTFAGWRAYRKADETYYCRNAAGDKGWYKKADIPKGYYYNLYKDGATVAKTGLGTGDTVKMVAQWSKASYTVAYNANGGTGTMASTSHKNGVSKCLSANTFKMTNCTFTGWYLSRKSDGKSIYTNGTSRGWYVPGTQPEGYRLDIYEDEQMFSALSSSEGDVVTCYAQWTPKATGEKTFYVDYNGNGGTGTMARTTVVYGVKTKTTVGTFTKSGYKITGWAGHRRSDDKWAFQDADGNRVWLTAAEKAANYPSYTIKPYTNGCNVQGTSSVDRDIVTFYAIWTPIDYVIEFDANGGTGTMSSLPMSYTVSNTLTANSYKKSGYKFSGWNALRASDSKWYCIDASTDTKSWLAEGSIKGSVVKYTFADKESVKNLTKTDADKITMNAIWTPITYTIAFDANGGTGKMSSLKMTYDVANTLTANAYQRAEYRFSGWNAFRTSDNKWYCIDTTSNAKSWLTEESITGNIVKYTFADKASVNKLTKVDADKVTMKAVWIPEYTVDDINYVNIGTGFYAAISSTGGSSGSVLSVTKDLAGLEITPNTSSSTQIWRFKRQTNGSYKIVSMAGNKCLTSSNNQVCVVDNSDSNAKNWYIVINDDNTYSFIPEDGIKNYEVMGASSTGSITVSEFNKSNEQKFNIEKLGNYMRGDVNMDGEIDVNDVTELQKLLLNENKIAEHLMFVADTDNNGTVDINDATLIQKYCADFVDYI